MTAGTAAAQPGLPPLPGFPGVQAGLELTADRDEVVVSVEQQAVVVLQVTNTMSRTDTPLDQPRTIGMAHSGVPTDWTVSFDPASFTLGPGEQQAVTMRVQVASVSSDTQALITVTARMYPAGVGTIPGLGQEIEPEATAELGIQAMRQEHLDRVVLEKLDGPWIFVVLLALLAAVLVAGQMIARNRRRAVALRAPSPTGTVPPGGRLSLPLQVQNIGGTHDTILLRVAELPPGWAAFLPVVELPLGPGRSEELDLVVIAPADAGAGARQHVQVTATGSQNPRRPATVRFDVRVDGRTR